MKCPRLRDKKIRCGFYVHPYNRHIGLPNNEYHRAWCDLHDCECKDVMNCSWIKNPNDTNIQKRKEELMKKCWNPFNIPEDDTIQAKNGQVKE